MQSHLIQPLAAPVNQGEEKRFIQGSHVTYSGLSAEFIAHSLMHTAASILCFRSDEIGDIYNKVHLLNYDQQLPLNYLIVPTKDIH